MRYSPRNIKVACDHEGLTHIGGIHFFHEFVRVLQLRNFLATHLTYPRRNNRYHLSQMIMGAWIVWKLHRFYAPMARSST